MEGKIIQEMLIWLLTIKTLQYGLKGFEEKAREAANLI